MLIRGLVIEDKEINGKRVFLVEGLYKDAPTRSLREAKFGLTITNLEKRAKNHLHTEIAQFYTLVNDGLILTRHAFSGLERPLYCNDSSNGDKEKFVYTRKPTYDYEWSGGRQGKPIRKKAPKGHIFAVFISPNLDQDGLYPEIQGWIEHWAWIEEDQGLSEAPINWVDRFNNKIWTQEKK